MLYFTEATPSPASIFTPGADSIIDQVICIVTTGATGGNPTVSVGYTGDPELYLKTTDVNLLLEQTYIYDSYVLCGGSPDEIKAYITPDSQSFTGKLLVRYVIPL
jgi:hypothetical protein